jgi:hypothetical protein
MWQTSTAKPARTALVSPKTKQSFWLAGYVTGPLTTSEVKPLDGPSRPRKSKDALPEMFYSQGFLKDLRTGRWMAIPCESRCFPPVPFSRSRAGS